MHFDLTNLTPSQLAFSTAIASIVAALIAGSAAWVVALTNARTGRNLAREGRRREYLIKIFEPFFERLDLHILECSRLIDFIGNATFSAGRLSSPRSVSE
jgi:hypothetical protein